MRVPLIRQGEGPAEAYRRMDREREEARVKLASIEFDTQTSSTVPASRFARGTTAGGDSRKLRGIPVLAKGVGSVQAGTCPHIEGARRADVALAIRRVW